MTLRGPQRSASQPTKGPTAPTSRSESAATCDMEERSQPNSASMGLMNTPRTARSPEAARKMSTTAPSMIQA